MSQYPPISYLCQRETGGSLDFSGHASLGCCGKKTVSFDIDPYNNGVIKPTSRVIWIQGWENLVFTLNSHGQVVVYNLLDSTKTLMLTKASENSFRIFFEHDSLFMAVKDNSSDFVQFFLVPLHSLQNATPVRFEILKSLKAIKSSVKEIDPCKFRIILEKNSTVEVWNYRSEQLVVSLPKNPSIHYQVTDDFFVFWETGSTDTKIGLFKFDQIFGAKFSVNCNEELYLCKVINNELVLGFSRCELRVVNLEGLACRVIGKGLPKNIFEVDGSDQVFMVFGDSSCYWKLDCCKAVELFESREYVCCMFGDSLIVGGSNGELAVFSDDVEFFDTKVKDVQQIGANFDAGQILLASKGKIWVIE